MVDFGTVLSIAQTLLSILDRPEVKEMWSIFGYKEELENLRMTMMTVKAVLLDAEAKQESLSNEEQLYIEQLKDGVYDADDLLDEFVTLAKQKQQMEGGKFSKKVLLFFSRYNQMGVAYNMSREVKRIRNKLDSIANSHKQFGFSVDYQPTRRRREETCSYVFANDIIGREKDVEMILDMLKLGDGCSSAEHDNNVPLFLTIVGMGGLGKTTLAQLVYNDSRIINTFDLRLWACVSDQDQDQLNLTEILGKILESITGKKPDTSTLDQVQRQLRRELQVKKYLLVLDDIWTENREQGLKLEQFFKESKGGSRVLVTTRSRDTATIVGNGLKYELQGLSNDHSWHLFKKKAFQEAAEQASPPSDLVEIGQAIVKQCANVPLAIRAVASLLYGQGKTKWDLVLKMGLANLRHDKNGIIPILKLSYHHLESSLKSCFSYCALFPKDFEIDKEMLINLWIAQGYVVPLVEGQNVEDAAEDLLTFGTMMDKRAAMVVD